jgi:hypothetical protein
MKRTHVVLVFPATLTMLTSPSQYFVAFFKKVVTCCANSLVGTKIRDRILLSGSCYYTNDRLVRIAQHRLKVSHTSFAIKTLCTAGKPYAAVFPLPVLAFANTSFPCRMRGIACVCTSVGCVKAKSARARNMRASRRAGKGSDWKVTVSSSKVVSISVLDAMVERAVVGVGRLCGGDQKTFTI